MITCFMGVMGSGKDYRADQAVAAGAVRVDFKDELILMVNDIVGYDIRGEYDWFKTALVGFRKPNNPISCGVLVSVMNELKSMHPELLTGRQLLQNVGTDALRKRDPDYWVKQYIARTGKLLDEGATVVTADCRFENEVRAIWRLTSKWKFVFTDYRSPRYDPRNAHPSEALAQAILSTGAADGQVIGRETFEVLFNTPTVDA